MLQEVENYLRHGDDALGLRRMMDLAFDTRNADLIRRVTQFSTTRIRYFPTSGFTSGLRRVSVR